MAYAYDAKEIIKSLEISDIIKILKSLNADHKMLDNITIAFNAICHSRIDSNEFKQNTFNLVYYDSSKSFICYSGCGRKNYNIFTLVSKIFETQFNEQLSFYESIEYVANLCDIEKRQTIEQNTFINCEKIKVINGWGETFAFSSIGKEIKKQEHIKELFRKNQEITKSFIENGEILELPEINFNDLCLYYEDFSKVKNYNYLWLNEGISLETIKKYQIMFDNRNKEIIIPHYDQNHRLVGVRSRLLNPEAIEQQGKYRPTYCGGALLNHPTSQVLYGLDKNLEEIKFTKKAILFEGEKSVLKLDSQLSDSKYNISLAVCGSSISDTQLKILKELGVEEIVIAFDKEFMKPENGTLLQIKNMEYIKKYDEYLEKRRRILNKVGRFFNVKFIMDSQDKPLLEFKQSPIDAGIDIFMYLCQNSVKYKKEDFL